MSIHWEYPLYCVITAFYIPILSGTVLVFTGLRIRAALGPSHRGNPEIRLHQDTTHDPHNTTDGQRWSSKPTGVLSNTAGSRRTLKIITFTSIAYFVFWSPYSVITLAQSFVSSIKPPPSIEFTIMWLANVNSAVNVFIYSSTNRQFRRQCVLLASRLCCSRFCHSAVTQRQDPARPSVSPVLLYHYLQ